MNKPVKMKTINNCEYAMCKQCGKIVHILKESEKHLVKVHKNPSGININVYGDKNDSISEEELSKRFKKFLAYYAPYAPLREDLK